MAKDALTAEDASDLIGVVYDSALEPDQWQRLRDRLCEMHPGHVATTVTFDSGRMRGIYSPSGFVTDRTREVHDGFTDEGRFETEPEGFDQEGRAFLRRFPPFPGQVIGTRDAYDDDAFRATAAYRTMIAPAGCWHWSGLVFAVNGTRHAMINLIELAEARDRIDPAALRRTLALIAPHVVRAARIARALYMAKEAAETYKGFLDAIALPLVLTDASGRLQSGNMAGQRMLDRGGLFRLDAEGRVAFAEGLRSPGFRACLSDVAASGAARGLRIDGDAGSVSLCIAPFHPAMLIGVASERDVYGGGRLLAIFAGSRGDAPVDAGLLQDVFGLTAREAEVCSALGAGLSAGQIAVDQGRAEKTIRNQIQAVLEKVGVTSSRELYDALSVFRTVGAMFDGDDPHLFAPPPKGADASA